VNSASAGRHQLLAETLAAVPVGLLCQMHQDLHWLNIPERVSYKLCMLTHRCLLGKALRCLSEYCVPVAHVATRQHLRTTARHQLTVPRHRLSTYGRRALPRALWPSTLCLIICVIHQSTLQRLRDHWKLTCSLLASTLSALEVLPRNALDKSTYLFFSPARVICT